MALQFSSRVTKNMAAHMVAGRENDNASNSSRLVIAFISNAVSVPTQSSDIFNYLNTCLNFSAFGGTSGAGANAGNVLGYYYFPDTNSGALEIGQNGNIISYVGPTIITALQTGIIGSIIVYCPNTYTTNQNATFTGTGLATVIDANQVTAYGIGSQTSLANYNTYAPTWFRGVSLITDSVGDSSSSAMAKFNTLSTTQGQTFTLSSINVKISSFN